MKIFLILLTIILIISCAENPTLKTDNSSKPVIGISPISNQIIESNPFPVSEIIVTSRVKIPAFPTPEKISMEDFLRKENRNRLSKFGLYDLETKQIPKDDIEIRIWQISDLYMRIYKD